MIEYIIITTIFSILAVFGGFICGFIVGKRYNKMKGEQ